MADDFSIKQIEMELTRLRGQMSPQGAAQPAAGEESANFGQMLKDAINEVNQLTLDADEAVETQAISGESTDLHSTIIALQKAETSFQTMMQIRNKIIKAYEEIMRMPI
jgi:flagellar hook-basal body complex protein FliE